MLPGMSGVEILKRMQSPIPRNTRAVMLSGQGRIEVAVETINWVLWIIHKPLT